MGTSIQEFIAPDSLALTEADDLHSGVMGLLTGVVWWSFHIMPCGGLATLQHAFRSLSAALKHGSFHVFSMSLPIYILIGFAILCALGTCWTDFKIVCLQPLQSLIIFLLLACDVWFRELLMFIS